MAAPANADAVARAKSPAIMWTSFRFERAAPPRVGRGPATPRTWTRSRFAEAGLPALRPTAPGAPWRRGMLSRRAPSAAPAWRVDDGDWGRGAASLRLRARR